jgi:hypothetical protein
MILHTDSLAGLSILQSAWIDLESAAGVVATEEEGLTTMGYWLERMRAGGERLHDATYCLRWRRCYRPYSRISRRQESKRWKR